MNNACGDCRYVTIDGDCAHTEWEDTDAMPEVCTGTTPACERFWPTLECRKVQALERIAAHHERTEIVSEAASEAYNRACSVHDRVVGRLDAESSEADG